MIHEGLYTNTITRPRPDSDDRPCNLAYHFKVSKGDPEAGFAQADVIVENTFRTHMVHQGFIEPFAALAAVDASGRLTVWTQTQGFFMTQQMLAQYLELPSGPHQGHPRRDRRRLWRENLPAPVTAVCLARPADRASGAHGDVA